MTDDRIIYRTAIPEALHKAVARQLKRRKLTTSEGVREALAAWVDSPELAHMPMGRPKTKGEE